MTSYTVLRDLRAPQTAGPFESGGDGARTRLESLAGTVPPEPVIEKEELTKREVQSIARDQSVLAVAPVMPTRLVEPVDSGAAATDVAWGIRAVGADVSSRTGSGVVVSVLDTGIDSSHPAFSGVALVEADFSGSGNGDRQGHGTHCAGTVFGRDVDGRRIGVAVGVERALIGKVLSDNGSGDSDMLYRGIQWAVEQGAQVVSMSLGFDFPGLVKRLADDGWPVDLATSVALQAYRANVRMFDAIMLVIRRREPFGSGTVVVAAAGNESRRNVRPEHEIAVSIPAAAEGVVSVGALGESDAGLVVAPFSNTLPQVSGPGVDVLSAKVGGGLRSLSGTSMATPHVAGVTALWWEEVMDSPTPTSTDLVTARLLANAATTGFADGVDVADRGVGIVRAPVRPR